VRFYLTGDSTKLDESIYNIKREKR